MRATAERTRPPRCQQVCHSRGRYGSVLLKKGDDISRSPVNQARTDLFAPLFFLKLARWEWIVCVADQIGRNGSDVVGEIYIFGET